MEWKGTKLTTMGLLMKAVEAVETREEAKEFMKLYSAETPHAYQNIGYCAGYLGDEARHRIFEWFDTSHPFFGRSDPTPEEAFEAGKKLGREGKFD